MRLSKCSLLLLIHVPGIFAAEFTAQIVDGLERPVTAVRVEVSCVSPKHKTKPLHFSSDQDGIVHGTYDAALCTPSLVSIEKQGYESYSSGFRSRYILRRLVGAQEVLRVVGLDTDIQQRVLLELLAGGFGLDWSRFRDLVFYYEERLRPALRSLAPKPQVTERVRELLSMVGMPEDLHLILQLPSPPTSAAFPERWRYAVATTLVNPDDENEWSFLQRCALNDFDDHWVDAGAIQTLKLTGLPRSLEILEDAQRRNQFQAARIAGALDYVKANPGPLAGVDLDALAKRVAEVLKLGSWEGNGKPRFNEVGDKALIDFTFQTGMDRLVYTATFHKIGDVWVLRGANETSQAFVGRSIVGKQ